MTDIQELTDQIRNGTLGIQGSGLENPSLAWLRAIIFGVDRSTLIEVAAKHGWVDGSVEKLERFHAMFQALRDGEPPAAAETPKSDRPTSIPKGQWSLLQCMANGLSVRYYGCPVYLVGSALRIPNPRDLDVVVVLPDDLFVSTYGDKGDNLSDYLMGCGVADPPGIWRRWARDTAKHTREWTEMLHRSCDVKIQPQHMANNLKGDRLRLDCQINPETP